MTQNTKFLTWILFALLSQHRVNCQLVSVQCDIELRIDGRLRNAYYINPLGKPCDEIGPYGFNTLYGLKDMFHITNIEVRSIHYSYIVIDVLNGMVI